MPTMFFFLSRAAALLLVLPLLAMFQDCHSASALFDTFTKLSEVEQVGVVTIFFILLATIWDLALGLAKVADWLIDVIRRVVKLAKNDARSS